MRDNQTTELPACGEFETTSSADDAGNQNGAGAEIAPAKHEARRQQRRSGKSASPRRNIYEDVTAKMVAELEAGRFPWVQPWATHGEALTIAAGLPKNGSTGATYSGINILLLWGAAIDHGFCDH